MGTRREEADWILERVAGILERAQRVPEFLAVLVRMMKREGS